MKAKFFLKCVLVAGLILPAFLCVGILSGTLPLGVEGQWVWRRSANWSGLLLPVLFFFSALIAARGVDSGKLPRRAALAGIFLLSIFSDVSLLSGGRAGWGESVLALLDPYTTGYLHAAAPAGNAELTARFSETVLNVPKREHPRHVHVHPPANVWISKLALAIPEIPGESLLWRSARRDIDSLGCSGELVAPADSLQMQRAAFRLLAVFLIALEMGKFLLCGSILFFPCPVRPGLAVLFVCFASGGAVLFCGHYDTFYFGWSAAILTVFLVSLRHWRWTVPCGVLTALGAMFSLGYGIGVSGLAAAYFFAAGPDRFRRLLGYCAGGFGTVLAAFLARVNCFEIAFRCWSNHRLFNGMATRNYFPWIWFNAEDALLFCGVLPSVLLFGWWFSRKYRAVATVGMACWLFLLFSGASKGEFGRLSILFSPVLLLMGGTLTGRIGKLGGGWNCVAYAAVAMAFLQVLFLRGALQLILIC